MNKFITKKNMQINHGIGTMEMKKYYITIDLSDIQAALGISQLKKNYEGVKKRNEIAKKYYHNFKSLIIFQ